MFFHAITKWWPQGVSQLDQILGRALGCAGAGAAAALPSPHHTGDGGDGNISSFDPCEILLFY